MPITASVCEAANGLVSDVFEARHMQRLQGNMGIGHVRYPTAGSSSASEAQPFYVNSPYGITLAHNGNLTNAHELRKKLFEKLLTSTPLPTRKFCLSSPASWTISATTRWKPTIFCCHCCHKPLNPRRVCLCGNRIGHGIVFSAIQTGFVRWYWENVILTRTVQEYMVASESVALDTLGFDFLRRRQAPGEAIYITEEGHLFTRECADNPVSNPCLFEYVYFARPDSFIDKISVYSARVNMGTKLGEKIAREWEDLDIDVVIPDPRNLV